MLDKQNIFDRYKENDIEVTPRWKSFNFKLKNESIWSSYCIFEDKNGQLKTKYVYI